MSTPHTRQRDLFEELAAELGCRFLSDLCQQEYRGQALRALRQEKYTGYPAAVWQDMLEYLSVPGARQAADEAQAKYLLCKAQEEWLRFGTAHE